ncbi:MAG: hypothetical protein P1U70_17660 [Saprospiraceae bacterium]|nr:hypothetical protein [Saprospiraceae bacterium]
MNNNPAKTIFLVCHYFPPDDNVGIRRVLFWANKFSESGYSVNVITTPKRNSWLAYEHLSDSINIFEFGIWGLRKVNRVGQVNSKSVNSDNYIISKSSHFLRYFKQKFVNKFFGQLFDNRLLNALPFLYHLKFSGKNDCCDIFKSINFNKSIIISTAPPWPVHLVSIALSKKFGLRLVIDYRDPFSSNHVFSQNFSSIESAIDRYICKSANFVTTVSPSWVRYYQQYSDKVFLIRNGYDESIMDSSNFPFLDHVTINADNGILKLGYFGSIEVFSRIPTNLIDFVYNKKNIIELNFYGRCSLAEEFVQKKYGHADNINFLGVCKYDVALNQMSKMSVNIVSESFGLTLSEVGLVPTKIYEYIRVSRPVLAIMSRESDSVNILESSCLLLKCLSAENTDFSFLYDNSIKYDFYPNISYIKSLSRGESFKRLIEIIN